MGLTQITTGGVDDNINIDSNTLKVDGTNNLVGIGTSSPGTKLDILGGSDASVILTVNGADASSEYLGLGINAGAAVITAGGNGSTSNALVFKTAPSGTETERLRIDSSGNVFIGGTTAASADIALNANGSASFSGNVTVQDGVSGVSTSASDALTIETSDVTSKTRGIGIYGKSSIPSTYEAFQLYYNGSQNVTIKYDGSASFAGNVGIGVSSLSSSSRLTLLESAGNAQTLEIKGANTGGVGSQPGIKFTASTGDNIGGIFGDTNSDAVVLQSGGTERLRIDSSGNVGIGTTSPTSQYDKNLTINGAGSSTLHLTTTNSGSSNSDGFHILNSSGIAYLWNHENTDMVFAANNAEKMRIDSSGRVLIGSSVVQAHPNHDDLQLGDGSGNRGLTISSGTSGYGTLAFGDSADGSGNDRYSGSIEYYHADNSMRFYANIGERMRIKNNGAVLVGQTTDSFGNKGHILNVDGRAFHTVEGNAPLWLNRQTNDGDLLKFYAQDVQEGAIVVSGTSVTLSGAHLSRWSQLPGGAARSEILRGSVLSNLDEMCEWGTEDNEQQNRMKVSDVEGDKNVSGVFQSWDDDDDTYVNDFYCAMTGDFVIRIAQGTTVARGDLLMSAGDGTAKPQDDDIVRSKTIAKVTSTTVSTTYSDNSYCVPCVLMAC